MSKPINSLDLDRAARLLQWLTRRPGSTTAEMAEALGLARTALQRAIKPLADAGLVLVETEDVHAGQNRPPRQIYRFSAVADPVWPDWLPWPEVPALPATHGPIVACAIASGAASVWAWAANDGRRAA